MTDESSPTYPMSVEKISLDHRGGTKSYHMILVRARLGRSILVKRWGKTGSFGNIKTELYDAYSGAGISFEKTLSEKMKKGYGVSPGKDPKPICVGDFQELRQAIGRATITKIGASNIKFIDPDADTTGMREADPPDWEDDPKERLKRENEKRLGLEEARRLAAEQEKREFEQSYSEIENFGAF